jgi:hypothetical protein
MQHHLDVRTHGFQHTAENLGHCELIRQKLEGENTIKVKITLWNMYQILIQTSVSDADMEGNIITCEW